MDPGRKLLAASARYHGDVVSVALAIGEAPKTSLKLAPPQSLETLLLLGKVRGLGTPHFNPFVNEVGRGIDERIGPGCLSPLPLLTSFALRRVRGVEKEGRVVIKDALRLSTSSAWTSLSLANGGVGPRAGEAGLPDPF